MSKLSGLLTMLFVQLVCVQLCTLLPVAEEANSAAAKEEKTDATKLVTTDEVKNVATKEVCGARKITTNRNPKIVNGTNAYHGQFPWAVSIKARNKHHCGGALLNRQWVLTAAHCVYRKSPTLFTLKIGGHIKLAEKETNSIEVNAKQMFAHSGFSFSNFRDDIALIKLDREVNYTDYISPVCLPSKKYYSQGDNDTALPNATVIGWGRLESSGASAEKLQLLELPIIDNERCIAWYKSMGRTLSLKSGQFCAGFEEGGKDACQGDSGGPLMIEDDQTNTTEVFGIVSAGIGCALPKLPGLYTKVTSYLQWMNHIMSDWSDNPNKIKTNIIKPAIITKKIVNATNLDHNPIVITNNHKKVNQTKLGQSKIKPAVINNSIIQNRLLD